MAERAKIAGRLKASFARANEQIALILAEEAPEPEALRPRLHAYICARFLLEEGECDSEDIIELSERSIQKAVQMRGLGVKVSDVSPGCADVSSAAAKKALLLTGLQKALGIEFNAIQAAYYDTVSDLAQAVAQLLKAKKAQT